MMNEGTKKPEGRVRGRATLGRVLVAALIAGSAIGALAPRAEAQTVIVDRTAPAVRTERVTDTTVVETEHPMGSGPALMVGGALMLTAGWVSSFAVGLHEGPELFVADEQLNRPRLWYEDFRTVSFIPIAGPWIALSQRDNNDFDRDGWGFWLIANGLLQAAGLTMFVSGAIACSARDVRYSRRRTVQTVGRNDVSVTPVASGDRLGLTVAGSF
jgi:hypothetical protein